jgi:hypothetical protein
MPSKKTTDVTSEQLLRGCEFDSFRDATVVPYADVLVLREALVQLLAEAMYYSETGSEYPRFTKEYAHFREEWVVRARKLVDARFPYGQQHETCRVCKNPLVKMGERWWGIHEECKEW